MILPRYAEYKESGVAWLGQIPSSWGVRRVKSLFEIKKRIAGEEGHEVLSITQRGLQIKDIESN
jgi:type I restriction enzyme S subunit